MRSNSSGGSSASTESRYLVTVALIDGTESRGMHPWNEYSSGCPDERILTRKPQILRLSGILPRRAVIHPCQWSRSLRRYRSSVAMSSANKNPEITPAYRSCSSAGKSAMNGSHETKYWASETSQPTHQIEEHCSR
eukprot:Amastigsp_a4096_38.p4 type:complete len:136 gc:universal Amastigsp_a4096_38:698-291(-)